MSVTQLLAILILAMAGSTFANAGQRTQQNVPVEIAFHSAQSHADPFDEIDLNVLFSDPTGETKRVPAFWDGGNVWKVRYASPKVGTYTYVTVCSDLADKGLNAQSGTVTVERYTGTNPLYKHGPIVVESDRRHLQHSDGTPFFWLGDTWWMGLASRLKWPGEFHALVADRVAKGFNVVQIVAGLYPDMFPFDPRGANESGFPWEPEYSRIRPEYFDRADKRIRYLVDQGLMPCIVGAWGYFLPWMGEEKMRKHWRYLVARYGSLPVAWCAAGEANLPWYLAKGFPYDDRDQARRWTDIVRYIRKTDPFHRLLTIHPTAINQYTSRHAVDDPRLLDFDMLQTPHGRAEAAATTVEAMRHSYSANPKMPVIDGEAAYEMLSDSLPTEWARAMFWICMMNGAAGHTYGANGIWQNNRPGDPHGRSPNGPGYGSITSQEAMHLPGSTQIGMGKKLLEKYPWQQFKPHPEWATYDGIPSVSLADSHWIWYPEGNPAINAPTEKRAFRGLLELSADKKIATARLKISADDVATVWINGIPIGGSSDWRSGAQFELSTLLLHSGKNVVAVLAENKPADVLQNPAGLIANLEIGLSDGSNLNLRSNSQWRSSKVEVPNWQSTAYDDSAWSHAMEIGHYGDGPWGRLEGEPDQPQSAGIPDKARMIYCLSPQAIQIHELRKGGNYVLSVFDPVSGQTVDLGRAKADAKGELRCLPPKEMTHDWLLIVRPDVHQGRLLF